MPKYDEYTKEQLLEEINKLTKQKKFGLVWEDKPEDVVEQCKTNFPVLQEIPERAILNAKYAKEAQSTQTTIFDANLCEPCENTLRPLRLENQQPTHLIIEGDNYHALSVLNVTHKGKIDVIYIDPPYNTGNKDFKYNDKFVDSEDNFRHSKWLSFMEKRLKLAKELLSESGVIFISIDDNEQAHLKLLCDEIFGESNFVAVLHWKKKKQPSYLHGQIAGVMEYVLVFSKNRNKIEKLSLSNPSDSNTRIDNATNAVSERIIKAGIRVKMENVELIKAGVYRNKTMETEYLDDVIIENGITQNEFRARGKFRDSQERIDKFCKEEVLFITKNYGFRRDKLSEELEKRKAITDLLLDWGDNQDSDKEVTEIFNGVKLFGYPKPIFLIRNLAKSTGYDNAIILDFFAGSGTTGHAVLELNREDGGNRQFILCTNNENGICEEVTYPRIKTVVTGNREDGSRYSDGIPANVRYFKTDFVQYRGLDDVSDEDRVNLTLKAGSMIAIKENVFQQTELNEWWQIFEDGEKMVAIYFKESKAKINELIEKIGEKKCVLYIFGWGKNEYAEEYGAENIEIKDIPEPILKIYKQINSIKN